MHIIDTLETAQNFSITGLTSDSEVDLVGRICLCEDLALSRRMLNIVDCRSASTYFSFDLFSGFLLGNFHIEPKLQIQPEFWFNAKILAQSKCGICCYLTLSIDNLIDSVGRNIEFFCQLSLRASHWLKKSL